MNFLKKIVLPVLASTVWISLSEFVRNEFVLKSYWTGHYSGMGLDFPDEPVNGALWGVWSLLLAVLIYLISRRFTLVQTALIAWLAAFVMMWVVIGNMGVLPAGILAFAIPWSLAEVFVAALIVSKTAK
ncbi:MAG: hypothetical protein JNL22_04800 [Bacteroidales bacterium]|nr:hypothetical protein [Bacteroidales bacterium]